MGSKSLSQEYEFSESEDSPPKAYQPIRQQFEQRCLQEKRRKLEDTISVSPIESKLTQKSQTEGESVNQYEASDTENIPPDFCLPSQRKVVYMYSKEMISHADKMIKTPHRASLVSGLIEAYGLHKYLCVIEPRPATFDELCVFHSAEYMQFLKKINDQDDDEKYDDEAQHFGLSYDCPAHESVYDYTALVSGASVQAAQCLVDGTAEIAINWCGGWHHGKKDAAAGFCYANDVVLGILRLREKFSRVLYVDLDVHHGDGVEDAFCSTNRVMTVSVHKYAIGFYPGTGEVKDVGTGKGKYYSVNIPLKDGIRDADFASLVCRILVKVKDKFDPEAVVCQCGADGLAGDPMESFNLTSLSLGKCVYTLLSWKLPLLLLGGGGYNHANTARCWTYLTGIAVGRKLSKDIPDHTNLMEFGPDYELSVCVGNKKDQNTKEYLQSVYKDILCNLSQISGPAS